MDLIDVVFFLIGVYICTSCIKLLQLARIRLFSFYQLLLQLSVWCIQAEKADRACWYQQLDPLVVILSTSSAF